MSQVRTFFKLFLFLTLLAFGNGADAASIINLSMANKGDGARIVVETSAENPFSIKSLSNPSRLIMDFADLGWAIRDSESLRVPNVVSDYRFGKYRDGRLRLVFDIKDGFSIKKYGTLDRANKRRGMRVWVDIVKDSSTKNQTFNSKSWKAWEDNAKKLSYKLKESNDGKMVVVLDPGHGGVDPGAVSKNLHEKKLVLEAALIIKKQLISQGFTVYLTREKDIFVPLRERFYLAESVAADVFISIHADKYASTATKGVTLYTLSKVASEKESELLAIAENRSDIIAGYPLGNYSSEVSKILISLAQKTTNRRSIGLANFLEKEIGRIVKLRKNPRQVADFAVLKSPNVPSVLLEIGFLSNADDRKLLSTPAFRTNIAKGISAGLVNYFKSLTN